MDLLQKMFARKPGPSERQIRRAIKQVTETHGDAAVRVSAMERLANWKTPEASSALLRRFTIQVPQATMDLEEKQYAVRLLVQVGRTALQPILQYLRTEPDVTWPIGSLREILPMDEFCPALKDLLEHMATLYTRWPEAKKAVLENVPDKAFPMMRDTVLRYVEDEDDDVCIAAIDYLARNGDEQMRENLIQTYLSAEVRPRVRGRILDLFCELDWPVKGYRKKIEETIKEPYYLTSKGTVKRRVEREPF